MKKWQLQRISEKNKNKLTDIIIQKLKKKDIPSSIQNDTFNKYLKELGDQKGLDYQKI